MRENFNQHVRPLAADAEMRSKVANVLRSTVNDISNNAEYEMTRAIANGAIRAAEEAVVGDLINAVPEKLLEVGREALIKYLDDHGYDSGAIIADIDVKSADMFKRYGLLGFKD